MRSRRRFLMLIGLLLSLLLSATALYMIGMARLEGDPRTFWRALEFAAETITTTGYGEDGSWNHPVMVIFVIILQFTGVVLMYMFIPVHLERFLEERFDSRLARQAGKIRDHVVIYRYGMAVETLTEELIESGVPLLVVEYDRHIARDLMDRKIRVVYEEERLSPDLDGANLPQARALITNGSDEENAAAVLVARQLGFKGEILALVEEPYNRHPIHLAGADAVFTPRHVLGAALAARASHRISPRISGIRELGQQLEVDEIRIEPDSPLAGHTLREAEAGRKTGAMIIGQWVQGHLEPQPTAAGSLEPRGIVVAVGSEDSLSALRQLAGGRSEKPQGSFLIAGYGEVGQKVGQLLRDAGEEIRVIDLEAKEGVDHVGDILEPRTLEALDPNELQGIILAVDSDRATLFATVIIREFAPDVPIIARVNLAENVDRTHHAGADFALSISQVSGKILAAHLLHEEAIELDTRLRVLKVDAPAKLTQRRPGSPEIRDKTGCSIVAVERGNDLILDFGADFAFDTEDTIYVCGTREATRRFRKIYS